MRRLSDDEYHAIDDENIEFSKALLPAVPTGYRWSDASEQNINHARGWWYLVHPPHEVNDGRIMWLCMSEWGKLCIGVISDGTGYELEPEELSTAVIVMLTRGRIGVEA